MRTSVRSHRVVAIVIACAVLGIGGWPAPALAQAPIVMKVATVNAGESPRNSAAYEFARVVGEKSKGRIKAARGLTVLRTEDPIAWPAPRGVLVRRPGALRRTHCPP